VPRAADSVPTPGWLWVGPESAAEAAWGRLAVSSVAPLGSRTRVRSPRFPSLRPCEAGPRHLRTWKAHASVEKDTGPARGDASVRCRPPSPRSRRSPGVRSYLVRYAEPSTNAPLAGPGRRTGPAPDTHPSPRLRAIFAAPPSRDTRPVFPTPLEPWRLIGGLSQPGPPVSRPRRQLPPRDGRRRQPASRPYYRS